MEQEEKVEGITLEYTYLLTQQLDSQRRYFEERLAELDEKNNEKVAITSALYSWQIISFYIR